MPRLPRSVVLAGVLLVGLFTRSHVVADEAPPVPKTVAVLDFQDLGPSVELAPLGKAFARMITTDLSAYGQIEVVARERVERIIRETHLGESGLVAADTAQKAGRALAADYLVQGTFAGAAGRIEVKLEVFDVAAGQVIGSEQAASAPDNVLAMEGKLLAAVVKALNLEAPGGKPTPQPGAKPVTLAVLYLQNLSPDAKLDPMEIGFADTLMAYLQDRAGIAVVEREQLDKVLDELKIQKSALGENGQVARIGQMLGAQVMLLGSFLVVKDTLRFDAHLAATDTGALLQALSVQGSSGDVDALVRALADKVAAALSAQPRTVAIPERQGKTSVEAMLHYSRGLALRDERHYPEAAEELQRCLYLDADNPSALAKLGWIYYHDLMQCDKAAEVYERLVAVGPQYLVGHANTLHWCYHTLGQPERGLEVLKRALDVPDLREADRRSLIFWLGRGYEDLRRPEAARYWFSLGLKEAKEPLWRIDFRDALARVETDREAAIRQWEAIIDEAPGADAAACQYYVRAAVEQLGAAFAQSDDYARAKRVFRQVAAKWPATPEASRAAFTLAKLALRTGRKQDATQLFLEVAEEAPELETAPESLLQAALLVGQAPGGSQQADELVRKVILRYGRHDGSWHYGPGFTLIRDLPVERAAPFEPGSRRPVLIDEGHAEASVHDAGQFGQFGLRAALLKNGQWAHVSTAPITHALLAGYSVLVLNSAYAGGGIFSPHEVEVIRSFVATGGGLLLNLSGAEVGQGTDYLQYGHLLAALGAAMPRASFLAGGPQPVTMNPKRVVLSGVKAGFISQGTALSVPLETVVATYQDEPVIAAFRFGLGRVLVCGLGSGLKDQVMHASEPQDALNANRALVRAAVEWLRGSDQQSKTQDAFEAAARSLAVGNVGGAVAILRNIVSANRDAACCDEARLLVADLLRSNGDTQTAAIEYQALATSAVEPQVRILAQLGLARCHAAAGGPGIERALEECWNVWRRDSTNPWSATALLEAGRWAYQGGNLEAAQQAFDAVMNAREHDMHKLQAMLWAALCRERRAEPATAARIYRTIAEEFPSLYVRVPGSDRLQDIQPYARARATELSP